MSNTGWLSFRDAGDRMNLVNVAHIRSVTEAGSGWLNIRMGDGNVDADDLLVVKCPFPQFLAKLRLAGIVDDPVPLVPEKENA